jgi:hypothetical protein
MNQQLSTFFTAIQTERDNRDLAMSRDWTAGSAREENDKAKSVKTLISLVATTLLGMASTIASLGR